MNGGVGGCEQQEDACWAKDAHHDVGKTQDELCMCE